jgi:PEP-CTERM motif
MRHAVIRKITIPSLFILCFGILAAARADTVPFNGTRYENQPAASPGGPCSPVPTLSVNNVIGIATGTSNLGGFTVNESGCLHTPFPATLTDGLFTWTFTDGDTLDGTWSGYDTRVNVPIAQCSGNQGTSSICHLETINETYLVTGGTGGFLDATGTIVETGIGLSNGVFSVNTFSFSGSLTGPDLVATPEPGTLALAGTGLMWAALRFRRPRKA